MQRMRQSVTESWSALSLAARLWWTGLTAVGIAAVLVLAATAVSDASSRAAPDTTPAAKHASSASASGSSSMAGMSMGSAHPGSSSSSGGSAQTTSTLCRNVRGATTMSDGMVMAPVPSGTPTASQRAAANQLVAETTATLSKFASLSTATAAGYTPATNPDGYLVHYANWEIAKNDGFDPSNPAFLMYANTVDGPKLLGAMYLGPAPCTPGPDIGGSLTQWHAHDNLCLSGGRVVGRTSTTGTCAAGVHNSNTYFMLHVWTEPSLASTHQFQPDLTRAELAPIIRGQA